MLRTPVCDLLGVDIPIIQASLGPWSSVELVAAVSEAGAIGSLGTALRSAEQVKSEIGRVRELTIRPFIVNHTARPLSEEAFVATLDAKPPIISFALGDPGELVKRAHDAGALFIQQVHTVRQAYQAAERGVDVIIAQGGEAGGFGGVIGALPLIPQVVDAVSPLPVVAAGGIADGRGLAAALVLGAQGANIGTRFLASTEAAVSEEWKQALLGADSDDAVKLEFADEVFPPAGPRGYTSRPRVLRTPFVEEWNARPDDVKREATHLRAELLDAVTHGRGHELVPFTGQIAGLIHEILPVGEIVRRLVAEAEAALGHAAGLRGRSAQSR
jgi:nitronate monooxygenase/enoyl-[acyl-carrier protein] reductase II